MTFSINDFRAGISKGIARPVHYFVDIALPAGLAGNTGAGSRLGMLCESAQLPGRTITTTDHMIFGTARKMPYGSQYQDLALTFICTEDMEQRSLFEAWHSLIQNPQTLAMNYYDNYTTQICITKLMSNNQPAHITILDECYPVSIEAQNLSYSENDSYLKLEVNFAYWKHYSVDLYAANGGSLSNLPEMYRQVVNINGQNISFPAADFNLSQITNAINVVGRPFGMDIDSVISNIESSLNNVRTRLTNTVLNRLGI